MSKHFFIYILIIMLKITNLPQFSYDDSSKCSHVIRENREKERKVIPEQFDIYKEATISCVSKGKAKAVRAK